MPDTTRGADIQTNLDDQRTTAGGLATGQTQKGASGQVSINTGATVTISTVTAGKTYYITDIHLSTDATAAPVDCQIQVAGVTVFRAFVQNTAPLDMAGIETQPFATATQVVTLLLPTVTGKNVDYFINGFEQ